MKNVTQLKSLGDMRTVISTHLRSVPRHNGSNYLDILSLGMEKQRLETELERLSRCRMRIERRLRELHETMEKRLSLVQKEIPPLPEPPASVAGENREAKAGDPDSTRWKKLIIEY